MMADQEDLKAHKHVASLDEKKWASPAGATSVPMLASAPEDSRLRPRLLIVDPPETNSGAPLSPYTAERNLVRDLTLPSVPNMDIPISPPGSPAPGLDEKVRHFLKIKKQGQHFNDRLNGSIGAKNPTVTEKLMEFARVGDMQSPQGLRGMYQTTLPSDIFSSHIFPEFAFQTSLRKTREKIVREHQAERASGKRRIDFMPAITPSVSASDGSGRKYRTWY